MDRIPAIPTSYRGVNYKSKLEAGWAAWLAAQDAVFRYEDGPLDLSPRLEASRSATGALLGYSLPSGKGYLPDFWLPQIRTFIEAKGDLTDASIDKMREFATCLGDDHMVVLASHPVGHSFSVVGRRGGIYPGHYSQAARCCFCGTLWFFVIKGPVICRVCEYSHGNLRDLRPFPTPRILLGDGTYRSFD